ncbi:MAG: orotate phosphoribosyltransferase [Bacteroidota bacterium]
MSAQCFDASSAKEIAQKLLEINAIKLQPEQPFTWASGWKSPIYCDNRVSLSYPAIRKRIKELFAAAIQKEFPLAECVAGVATAGIPQGALVADALDLPFVYVRSSSKSHGLENRIEGHLQEGSKVVVLEDLVSTGGSSLQAVEALRAAGAEVLGMVSIFTYNFPIAEANLSNKNVDLVYLSDYTHLIEVAIETGLVGGSMAATLSKWREDPGAWGG